MLKNYHEFLRFFFVINRIGSETTQKLQKLKSNSENVSASTLFIHFDGLCNHLNLFQKQPAANFFNSCCFSVDFAAAKESLVAIIPSSASSSSSSGGGDGSGSDSTGSCGNSGKILT